MTLMNVPSMLVSSIWADLNNHSIRPGSQTYVQFYLSSDHSIQWIQFNLWNKHYFLDIRLHARNYFLPIILNIIKVLYSVQGRVIRVNDYSVLSEKLSYLTHKLAVGGSMSLIPSLIYSISCNPSSTKMKFKLT